MGIEQADTVIAGVFPGLHGWCSIDKGCRMVRLVAETPRDRPALCVELGVFGARGVIAMGLAVRYCLAGNGRVDGIDPYTATASLEGTHDPTDRDWWARVDYGAILESARQAIERTGVQNVVHLILKRSDDVVHTYAPESIDVLHQDSNHSAEVSTREVHAWVPKMRPGGYWVFDDINWPTTKQAQETLLNYGFALLENHESWAVFQAPR